MKALRKLLPVLLVLALLCGAAFAAESGSANAATIRNLEGSYTVAQDGSCTVELTAEMRFSAGVTEFALPVPAQARDLAVTAQGYSTRHDGGALLVVLQSPTQLSDQTVVIHYRLAETVLAGETAQTCTLGLLRPERACPIERYSATITLPEAFEAMPQFESGYYADLIENYLDIRISDGKISLRAQQPLRDHESLTMTLELPEGYFDLRFLAGKTARIDTLLFWAFLGLGLAYWLVFLRNRFLLPKAEAMPPLSGNPGAAPYIVTGEAPDLALMAVHWASLGYLSITRLRGGRILLEKQMDMGNERRDYEIQIFRSLFARNDTLRAPCDDYRMTREKAVTVTKGQLAGKLFAPHAGRPVILRLCGALSGCALTLLCYDRIVPAQLWRWFAIVPLTLLGGLACWLLQPVSACFLRRKPGRTLLPAIPALLYLILSLNTAKLGFLPVLLIAYQLLIGLILALGGKRSSSGLRQAEELLGLRRHLLLSKPESLRQLLEDDPLYFYRTLPYADALRVGGRFTKKFGAAPLEPCAWLRSEHRTPETAQDYARLYQAVLDTLREQTDTPLINLLRNLIHRRQK